MANVYSLNETTTADAGSTRHAAWRLTRVLKDAGWAVWGSSNGTDFSVAGGDYWTTLAPLLSAVDCWIALKKPGADGQGHCFQFGTGDQDFRYTYTYTSWDPAGVDEVTAPLAVGSTGYVIGSAVAYNSKGFVNSSATTAQASIQVINVVAKPVSEGGAFDLWCFDSDTTPDIRTIVQYSPVWKAPGVNDPHIFFTNGDVGAGSSGVSRNLFVLGGGPLTGSFLAFDSYDDFVSHTISLSSLNTGYQMFNVSNAWQGGKRVLSRPAVLQSTWPYSHMGVAKDMRFTTPVAAFLLFNGGERLNLTSKALNHGVVVMWDPDIDDVTVNRAGAFTLPSNEDVTPEPFEFGSDAVGTERLPGNGYHRARRRPRGVV